MPKQIFTKASVIFHAIILDDKGEFIDDMATEPITVKNTEEFDEKLKEAKGHMATFNSANNRAARRARK